MCGVVGYIDFKNKNNKNKNIHTMLNSIEHRGPDAKQYKEFSLGQSKIVLGHVRLSIQDLSSNANQPMSDIGGNYHIVYNGEVYNFKKIKEELKKQSYIFKTDSDTEVILYAYIEWGLKAIDKFVGMFSIVILDLKLKKMVFINDRLGVKPLYIYFSDKLLIFASELKGILAYKGFHKVINRKAVYQFMKYGYIQPPLSIFENIMKIEAGSIIEFDLKTKHKEVTKYWDIIDFINKKKKYDSKELFRILKKAFLYRTVSDVPFLSFLSSGIDSSLVAAIISENGLILNTITIGVDNNKYNEAELAKNIANSLNTNHQEYYINEKDLLSLVTKLPYYFDEPFADSSMYPTYLVSKLTSQKFKVALSSDGGDESFGGYSRYLFLKKYSILLRLPKILKKLLLGTKILETNKILNLFSIPGISLKIKKIENTLYANNISEFYEALNSYISNERLEKLIKNNFPCRGYFNLYDNINERYKNDILNTAMAIDYKTYLYQVLTKVDRASMANSIEVREPLLDHNIIEYALSIPSEEKIHRGKNKVLLSNLLSKYLDLNLLTKTKKGFSVPIEQWLKKDLLLVLNQYVNKETIIKSNIFNWDEVCQIKNKFNDHPDDYIELWHIFIFQLWYNQWVEEIVEDNK